MPALTIVPPMSHSATQAPPAQLALVPHEVPSLAAVNALVLTLGFDIYKDDPQSLVAVTTQGFGRLGSLVRGLGLPTLVVQEGGYHLESLTDNTVAFFSGFLGKD